MKKIALALLSFVLAAATWAGLYAFFFSVGKENYVAVIATYGVLPILFLTKVIYDSVQPSVKMQLMGCSPEWLLQSSRLCDMVGYTSRVPMGDRRRLNYNDDSLAPFAIIVLLPAVFLAKVIYDTLARAVDWVVER